MRCSAKSIPQRVIGILVSVYPSRRRPDVLDQLRKVVEAGMGKLSTKRAEELARSLAKQGQERTEQVTKVAKELLEWSKKSGERLASTVKCEVKKQVSNLGFATKREVEALKKRVAKLETKPKPRAKSSAAKK